MTSQSSLRSAVLVGSTRPGRRARAVAEWVAADASAALELTVLDVADFELPLLDEPAPAAFGPYARAATRAWSDRVREFDAFVLVTPEYNHSTSAALKNALDHLYHEWQDKPVAFAGYGAEGGTRAVEHLRGICAELGMAGVGPQVALRLADDFSEEACAPRSSQEAARERMLGALSRWAGALRVLRRSQSTAGEPGRPVLDTPALRPTAEAAARDLACDLQDGLDAFDADRYDRRFAEDVLWGSPYGATIAGVDTLLPIHQRLMAQRTAPASRFELVQLMAPASGIALAHIRRQAPSQEGFSEMALYVLIQRDGQWWLAAAQNTPIAPPPTE